MFVDYTLKPLMLPHCLDVAVRHDAATSHSTPFLIVVVCAENTHPIPLTS
jgi:hypothetical protein